MLVIVGSRAINAHVTGFRANPVDWDFVATYDDFKAWVHANQPKTVCPIDSCHFMARHECGETFDFEIAWPGSSADMLLAMPHAMRGNIAVPSLDILFTIKASHRYKKDSPHFEKTLMDYHKLKGMGCRLVEPAFYDLRQREYYNYAHPKLKQGKQTFFSGDAVKYTYDHDSIHVAVANGKPPAYTLFGKDGEEVYSSRAKFFGLPREEQLRAVLEESYVLAIERSQVPFPGALTPLASFKLALSKVCTSITSGWFREFAYENYFAVVAMYSDEYLALFNDGVRNGTVRRL